MNKIFSERIKDLRLRKGWVQADLALAVGFSQGAVGNWELGINRPAPPTLKKIAFALGTSMPYLLGETDDPGPDIYSNPSEVRPSRAKEESATPYGEAGTGWAADITARLSALNPEARAPVIRAIHSIIDAVLSQYSPPKTIPRLPNESELDPAVVAAFDELAPHIVNEALRRERESRKPPEKPAPVQVVDGYSSRRK
jgi:transcriptional regulator with XRE-family HTH domain